MNNYGIPQNAVITIAGTVGVGKSTLTQALADKLNFKTSFENVDHNPYLDKFYHNFERWSFHLQIYFLAERFKEQNACLSMVADSFKIVQFMKMWIFLQNARRTRNNEC